MAFLQKCFGGCGSTCEKQPSATIEDLCHRFSLSQLRKSTDGFHKSRIIGKGVVNVVYRASISINGQLKNLALERFNMKEEVAASQSSRYKENIIYRCLVRHPNVVSLVGFCDDGNELIVAYDYAPNGSLRHQLHGKKSNSSTLSWKKRLEISIGVARGLHFLHSGNKRTIIHCNVKLSSILLDENWVPKLNFNGFSVKGPKFSERKPKPKDLGFPYPNHIEVTHKCDVYSFGLILLELVRETTKTPILFEDWDFKKLRNWAETGNAKEFVDERVVREVAAECLKLYMEIAESCLSEDPEERPDMGEVEVQLEHVLQLQEEADTNHACLI